jgi:hypothetical protein
MKTFWTGIGGWADTQRPDGTVVWTPELAGNCAGPLAGKPAMVGAYSAGMTDLANSQRLLLILAG